MEEIGTIKCGFWQSRFLISPEEWEQWVHLCKAEGFSFTEYAKQPDIVQQYTAFYQQLMDPIVQRNVHTHIVTGLTKEGFHSGFHLLLNEWSFYPPDKGIVRTKIFVQLSTPKHYAVDCEDKLHFTYEDIHQKEPRAKETFDKLTTGIKSRTKPLYYQDRPCYSIRISKQAYADLQQSAFFRESGQGLSSKWT